MLDRSAILRDAHAHARREMAQNAKHRSHGRRWTSYRHALAYTLKMAWAVAKHRAREAISDAAFSALMEIEDADPTNTAARIDALRAYARTLVPNSDGFRKIMADADDLAQAARCITIPAIQDHAYAL